MTAQILLIEDNPITCKMVSFALGNQGFQVLEASDGATALQAFEAHTVDLVLQDLFLPDVDGFELLHRLRALPKGSTVPIVAFSGLVTEVEEARIFAAGFDDLVTKPADPSRLLQVIRAHLPGTERTSSESFGRGRRVLVVDDDLVQRKLVAFHMKRVGFEVTVAADGIEALECARAVRPDAIVSDVLMPRLDGFGLCMKVRLDEHLSSIPVVLLTNSYMEREDQELGKRAGANSLILRSPDLRGLMEAVKASLDVNPPPLSATAADGEIEAERMRRVMRQLERQVGLNAGVTQRCALLSVELAVLTGISAALASQDDIEEALRHVLAACFDAGGISIGALYLVEDGELRALSIGLSSHWREDELTSFFGERSILDRAIEHQETLALPSPDLDPGKQRRVLERANASSALVVPLSYKGRSLGALLMMSQDLDANSPHRVLFGQAVAGQIAQALAVTHAFADKQASERVATERATMLRSILESIADGVVVVDDNGRFIHWNPAAEAIMRRELRQATPDDWPRESGLFETDRVTAISRERNPLLRAIAGEAVERMELFLRHVGSDDEAWLSVNARPWRDGSGRILGGVAAFRDITQEKAAQSQLMASDRMASVGMLAAGVAHEINNPLAAVVANLEMAHDVLQEQLKASSPKPGATDEFVELLDDARSAAERVQEIVRDLKTFSRHEEVRKGSVDIHAVLESSLRMAWNEIRHRSRLIKNYGAVGPVEGIEHRLGQVFLNLIVNAAQAIPQGHVDENSIRVVTRIHSSGRIAVEISDTGEGIPPEILQRLFRPFFTTKAPGIGTGLGLAICHRIIAEHGGEIRVESTVGKGTTFTVLLPAARVVETIEPVRKQITRATRRGRLLVIDDDPLVGTAIGRIFAKEHEVVTTSFAKEALARIRGGEFFDVILCDLVMPQITGMEFYRELLSFDPEYARRIIFLTGGTFTRTAQLFLEEVDNQRVEKPFNVRHLRGIVNEKLTRPS